MYGGPQETVEVQEAAEFNIINIPYKAY